MFKYFFIYVYVSGAFGNTSFEEIALGRLVFGQMLELTWHEIRVFFANYKYNKMHPLFGELGYGSLTVHVLGARKSETEGENSKFRYPKNGGSNF